MADSQRKTANLFDEVYPNISSTTQYISIYVGSGTYTLSTTTPALNVDYTQLFLLAGQVTTGASSPTNGVSNIKSRTVTAQNGYITIAYRSQAASVNPENYSTMLNTGSTPLPYEPYGWVHSLRKLGTSTDTLTTLPADVYADGNNATVGLVGNMSQSGTPTPQNPIQPSECGERTANLLNPNGTWSPPSGQTADVTVSGNSITITGKYYAYTSAPVTANENYTAKYSATGDRVYVVAYRAQPFTTANMITSLSSSGTTINVGNTDTVWLLFYSGDGTTGTTTYSNFMFNEGSTPLDFEPYGYKIPISSASTTTPVYLGEVETTRKIRELVLTGDEAFSESGTYPGGYLYMFIPSDIPGDNGANAVSTHYKQAYNNNGQNVYIQSRRIVIIDATHSTRDDFKSYLAQQYANGTPVTVWYVLATPTTGIVNEPLRKIRNYADEVSGITIPTIAGANAIDVDTTLKPSKVSVNYHAWHPVQSVHEAENGQWN